jgi:hypothetical protein
MAASISASISGSLGFCVGRDEFANVIGDRVDVLAASGLFDDGIQNAGRLQNVGGRLRGRVGEQQFRGLLGGLRVLQSFAGLAQGLEEVEFAIQGIGVEVVNVAERDFACQWQFHGDLQLPHHLFEVVPVNELGPGNIGCSEIAEYQNTEGVVLFRLNRFLLFWLDIQFDHAFAIVQRPVGGDQPWPLPMVIRKGRATRDESIPPSDAARPQWWTR